MSMFIEVYDEEKRCDIIVNLDAVIEIAPKIKFENGIRKDGGCDLYFSDQAAVGGKRAIKVSNSYTIFKQFVLQTVSEDDIAARIKNLPKVDKEPFPRFISDTEIQPQAKQEPVHEIPQTVTEEKRGRGRPPKSEMGTTTSNLG